MSVGAEILGWVRAECLLATKDMRLTFSSLQWRHTSLENFLPANSEMKLKTSLVFDQEARWASPRTALL